MKDAENNSLNCEAQTNDVAVRMNDAIHEITAQFAQMGLDLHLEDDVARDDYDDDDKVIATDTGSDADADSDADTDTDADADVTADDADQNNQTEQFTLENDGKQVESDLAWSKNLLDDESNNSENTIPQTSCHDMKRRTEVKIEPLISSVLSASERLSRWAVKVLKTPQLQRQASFRSHCQTSEILESL